MERTYHRPQSLEWALEEMANPGAVLLAGGTDLLVQWRELTEAEKPQRIVDLSGLDELRQIREEDGEVVIGSMVTHRMLAQSAVIRSVSPPLAEAAFSVGSPQIRNRGTVGGSLANASPAADLAPVLVALGARVCLESRNTRRELPVSAFLQGMNKTALESAEIIRSVKFSAPAPGLQGTFQKVGRRNAVAIARLNGVCLVRRDATGRLDEVTLVIGSATPTPLDMSQEARELLAQGPEPEALRELALRTVRRVEEIAGVRASARWKFPAVENLVLKLFRVSDEGGSEHE